MLEKTLQSVISKEIVIEIFGLGYVGFPLAVRLANNGFSVIGIDIDKQRISRLENDELKESENSLKNEFLHSRQNGKLILSEKPIKSELPKIGIICVHTPLPNEERESNYFVKSAVGKFLETSKEGDLIILESSVAGGTTEIVQNVIESENFKVSTDYGLAFCPERIDPQNKKWHLENIPRIIYCSDDITFKICQRIYHNVNKANLHRVASPIIAEIVKSYENAFRLVNISLVNELAMLCDRLGINVKDVINAAATKPFGFIPFYPSAGAGGHCIPKDPKFLLEAAKKNNFTMSTIENAFDVNVNIPEYICNRIEQDLEKHNLEKTVLICGLTYKPNVEDMRDSPGFKIANELKSRNFKTSIYDPFFKPELFEKYLIENYISELDCEQKNDLNDDALNGISCLCIVQHHSKNKFRLHEIYEKSLIPLIYDCQNVLEKNSNSKTILDSLGS